MSYALLAHWAVNMIWYLLRSVSTYNISVLFLFQLYSVCTNVESFVGLHAHDPTMGSSSIFVRAGPHTRIACEGREREKGDGGEKRDGGNGTCFGAPLGLLTAVEDHATVASILDRQLPPSPRTPPTRC